MDDLISRQQAIEIVERYNKSHMVLKQHPMLGAASIVIELEELPSVQPERKTGQWILDRSGAYCCDKCMEPCATYAMMKPRDKFCKMCGAKMEGGES